MRRLTVLLTALTFTGFMLVACGDSGTGPDPGNGSNGNGGGNGSNGGSETTTYTVDVSAAEGGSVSPSGSNEYEEGETVELQADPNEGYLFSGWTGYTKSSDNPLLLTVDQDYSIIANFEKKTYALTTSTDGEGAVEEKVVQEKSTEYKHGTVVELTANPAEGWKFVEWQGDVTGTDNPQQITVDSPKEVTAVFEKKNYKLTVNIQGEGAVSEEVVQAKDYDYGTTVKLTASPSEGWHFVKWQGDLTGTENPREITIDQAKEVTAVFEKKSYALTVNIDGNGSVTKSPDQSTYAYGTTVELEANPADGQQFVEWTGAIANTDNPVEVTVIGEAQVTVVFEQATFLLASNGVTVVCDDASVGDTGVVSGVTYTKRSADQITTDNAPGTCTSGITDMSNLFEGASSFNGDISHWDVSSVTNMRLMFFEATSFNQDLSSWDVSSVTSMYSMFNGASAFNGDLSNWDVSAAKNISGMFVEASSFNGDLSNWDVSEVAYMRSTFQDAVSFNGDVSSWDVSSVTAMNSIFAGASAFNRDLSSWDVSGVTSMRSMFNGASAFNGDLSNWDVSNVTNMSGMFQDAESFNGDLSTWDVSAVTNMGGMFGRATSFNGDLSSWDVSSVTDMGGMFNGASSFNGDLSSWDVSSVTNMRSMFADSESFNGDLSGWDVSNVTNMAYMFSGALSFNGDISSWNVGKVTDMVGMFYDASSFNQDLHLWCVPNISSEPIDFATGSMLSSGQKPMWGECK